MRAVRPILAPDAVPARNHAVNSAGGAVDEAHAAPDSVPRDDMRDEELSGEVSPGAWRRWLRASMPWMISMLVHEAALVLLALWIVSAAGGFDVDEPAADLPVALALSSVATGRRIREGLVSAGEIGLGGELRPIPRVEARLAEARRLGFSHFLLPARGRDVSQVERAGIRLLRARSLREALSVALE